MQVDCINAEELVDTTFVTVGDLQIEVGIFSSTLYEFVYRALTPPGSCWTTLDEAVNEVAPSPDTYPMLIVAEAISNGASVDIQVGFTINGISKITPYAESLLAGSYTIVFPPTIIINENTYRLFVNEFTINHPQNGESYGWASYVSDIFIETYRDINIMEEVDTGNLYFRYEGIKYLFSSNTPIEIVRARIDELLDGSEPPPPPVEWPVTRSLHLFDRVKLKALWYEISKSMSRGIAGIDTSVLVGGKLDYTVTYTQGVPIAEIANIAFDGVNYFSERIVKGETKSGSIDLTGLIGNEGNVTISFDSFPGMWSEVSFDIWVTLGFSDEPATEPTPTQPDWMKWVILGGAGIIALILLTRAVPKITIIQPKNS